MLRLLNIAVLTLLVGTAAWAYQTKYETIFYAEQVRKLEAQAEREKDQIAILKAEWQLLNRPTRLEQLAAKHLDLKPLRASQIARAMEIPERKSFVDQIGAKLDALGVTGSIPTPDSTRQSPGRTPGRTPAR
jgi:cell division protein FtsL